MSHAGVMPDIYFIICEFDDKNYKFVRCYLDVQKQIDYYRAVKHILTNRKGLHII